MSVETCRMALSAALVVAGWCAAADPPQTRPAAQIIDFSAPPLFTFLGWEKKAVADGAGLRIKAANCQGGAGYNLSADLSGFSEHTPALTLTVNEGNEAKALLVNLTDADGTRHEYRFTLEGVAVGAMVTVSADDGASLREPCKVGAPGKEPGFDAARVVQVVAVGDWKPLPVDITLHRLELVEATPQILKARESLRARLAKAEADRLKAEQERARRKQELLGKAPHPDDGPDVTHIGLVAPDVLALAVQEKRFVASPQVPYEPKPGDEVRHTGERTVLAIEGGKVVESPLEVVVTRKEGGKAVTLGHLAINAGRIKPEDKSVGQDLTTETVDEPAAYRIWSADDAAWKDPAPPAQVWWKRKPNAYRSMAHQVHVFLKLGRPLTQGKTYRIEFPGVNFRQAWVEYRHEPTKVRSEAVHTSAIGYRPDDPFKRAYLSVWMGTGGGYRYPEGLKFHLLDDGTTRPVFSGKVEVLARADDNETFKAGRNYSKTDVLGMDFSAFSTPGRYRVYVEGIGCSYPLTIGPDVWTEALRLSMKGLLHHRSGIELGPPLTDYVRPRNMHPADGCKVFASAASEIEGGSQDGIFHLLARSRTDRLLPQAWGGHMDAGDWDRNAAHPAAMWLLVELYELFPQKMGSVRLALPPAEAANAIPDVLDEVLWNLEMYRRLQTPEGGVGGGIESTAHPRPGEASWQESLLVSAYAPDPRSSLIYCATAAKLARALAGIDKPLSDAYAASARKAWQWAVANCQEFLGRAPENSRERLSDEFRNRRNLAALELWRLTGDQAFHDDFAATTLLTDPGAEHARQLRAITSYALLPDGQGDAALRQAARKVVIRLADAALRFGDGNAFGVTVCIPQLPPMGFVGYLSTPETAVGPVLPYAYLLTREAKYLAGAVRACQFAAGANPDNRALTTGLGPDPVRFPLHIDSWVTGQPAPAGITVYGASDPAENYQFDAWAHTWFLQKMTPPSRTWPAHESYWDIYVVPSTNEYTIHQTIIPTAFYWGFLAARP